MLWLSSACNRFNPENSADQVISLVENMSRSFESDSRHILNDTLISDKGLAISKLISSYNDAISNDRITNAFTEAYYKTVKDSVYIMTCLNTSQYHSTYKIQCLYNRIKELVRSEDYDSANQVLNQYLPELEFEISPWYRRNFNTVTTMKRKLDSLDILSLDEDSREFKKVMELKNLCESSFFESEMVQQYDLFIEALEDFRLNYPKSEYVEDVNWQLLKLAGDISVANDEDIEVINRRFKQFRDSQRLKRIRNEIDYEIFVNLSYMSKQDTLEMQKLGNRLLTRQIDTNMKDVIKQSLVEMSKN